MNDAAATSPLETSPLLERQLAKLDRMADAGLELAEALVRQAKGAGPQVTEGDLALAYTRVSRAVRLAIMLQSRLVGEAEVRKTAERQTLAEAAGAADMARTEQQDRRKGRISLIVERVARAGGDDREAVDRLAHEADDRLDDDGLIGDVLTRPVSEIVAQICKDLGLDPDWTRLAQEAWAQEELASGEAGWPLANLRTSPIAVAMAGGGPPAAERAVEGAGGGQEAASSFADDSS